MGITLKKEHHEGNTLGFDCWTSFCPKKLNLGGKLKVVCYLLDQTLEMGIVPTCLPS